MNWYDFFQPAGVAPGSMPSGFGPDAGVGGGGGGGGGGLQSQEPPRPSIGDRVEQSPGYRFLFGAPPEVAPNPSGLPAIAVNPMSPAAEGFLTGLNPANIVKQEAAKQNEPAPPSPVDPYQVIQDEVAKRMELLKGMMGEAPKQPQQQYDASQEKNRTKYLAQLALAAGITSGAGANWKGVGQGFAAAGEVYDEGFKRYRDVLQKNAEIDFANQQAAYQQNADLVSGAYDMYDSERKAARDIMKQSQERLREDFKLIYGDAPTVKYDDITGEPVGDVEAIRREREKLAALYGIQPIPISGN